MNGASVWMRANDPHSKIILVAIQGDMYIYDLRQTEGISNWVVSGEDDATYKVCVNPLSLSPLIQLTWLTEFLRTCSQYLRLL